MARMLAPESFGSIAVISVLIQLSQSLTTAGFNKALIQRQGINEEDYSSVFWVNLIVSFSLYFINFLIAPYISDFYNQPILTPLIRVFGILFVINSFSLVQETRLIKEMKFKNVAIINLPSVVLGGFVGVMMAKLGYEVWSIVFMQIATRVIYVLLLWWYSKWKPLFILNWEKIRGLFSFGGKIMLSEFIHIIYQNIYVIIIGKLFPIKYVGYYHNANNLVTIPSNTVGTALNSTMLPIFSTIQDNNNKIAIGYKKIISQILFLLSPVYIFLGVLAEPLFYVIFTEKWMPAVPFFQWLCIIGIFTPISNCTLEILNVKGRSDLFLNLEIIKKVITTAGLLVVIKFGIWELVAFQVITFMAFVFLNSYVTGKQIGYNLYRQLADVAPNIMLSLITGLILMLVDNYFADQSFYFRIIAGLFVFFGLYVIGARMFKLEAYLELQSIIKKR